MQQIVVRLVDRARGAHTSNPKCAEATPFTFCTTGGAYCQKNDVILATSGSPFYGGVLCLGRYFEWIPMAVITGCSATLVTIVQWNIRVGHWTRRGIIRAHMRFAQGYGDTLQTPLARRWRLLPFAALLLYATRSPNGPVLEHTVEDQLRDAARARAVARTAGIPCDTAANASDPVNGPVLEYTAKALLQETSSARDSAEEFARDMGIIWDDSTHTSTRDSATGIPCDAAASASDPVVAVPRRSLCRPLRHPNAGRTRTSILIMTRPRRG